MPRKATATTDRREAILDAALGCFVTRGFHGTSVPEVAGRAGIAAGTMYHYFESKEALVNALFRKWKHAVEMRVFLAFPQGAPPREQFHVMWQEITDFAMSEPDAFAFLEFHHHASYLDDESRAVDHRLKDFAVMMVQQAQTQGAIRKGPPKLLMELIFGSFIGMIRAYVDKRLELDAEALELAEEACWDALSPPD